MRKVTYMGHEYSISELAREAGSARASMIRCMERWPEEDWLISPKQKELGEDQKTRRTKPKYRDGEQRSITRPNGIRWLNASCVEPDGCEWCGFNVEEAARRKDIPLEPYTVETTDADGHVTERKTLRRKYIGK